MLLRKRLPLCTLQSVRCKRKISFDVLASIPTIVQTGLISFHSHFPLPWWGTIATSTLMVRLSLMPLVRAQIVVSRKLGKAMPEIVYLGRLASRKLILLGSSGNVSEIFRLIKIFLRGVKSVLLLHDVSLSRVFMYPFINIGIFFTFVYSIRDLVLAETVDGLKVGGELWFKDLTVKDSTGQLPFSAVCLSAAAIEVAFIGTSNRWILTLKHVCQGFVLCTFPVVMGLPSGVFCYWIPSVLFGAAQGVLFKNPNFQRLLRIPAIAKPPGPPPPL